MPPTPKPPSTSPRLIELRKLITEARRRLDHTSDQHTGEADRALGSNAKLSYDIALAMGDLGCVLTVNEARHDERVKDGTMWIKREGKPLLRASMPNDYDSGEPIPLGALMCDTNDRYNDGADRWREWRPRVSELDEACELVPAMSEDEFEAMPRDPHDNVVSYEATKLRMLELFPGLFVDENDVLHHLFFVNGNGYEWWAGVLIESCGGGFDIVPPVANPEEARERERQRRHELIQRGDPYWALLADGSFSRPLYSLCEYTKILHIPDDYQFDWLDAAEHALALVDSGHLRPSDADREWLDVARQRIAGLRVKALACPRDVF